MSEINYPSSQTITSDDLCLQYLSELQTEAAKENIPFETLWELVQKICILLYNNDAKSRHRDAMDYEQRAQVEVIHLSKKINSKTTKVLKIVSGICHFGAAGLMLAPLGSLLPKVSDAMKHVFKLLGKVGTGAGSGASGFGSFADSNSMSKEAEKVVIQLSLEILKSKRTDSEQDRQKRDSDKGNNKSQWDRSEQSRHEAITKIIAGGS